MAASLQVKRSWKLTTILFSTQSPPFILSFINLRHITADSYEGDPNDPKYAKWKAKIHPEAPTKFHPDRLSLEPVKGKTFEKLPFRILLKAKRKYTFCTCGYSKNQPFCDASHKSPHFMASRPHHLKYRPMSFTVNETKEYWLCMCKQSDNRPFCDGTHKQSEIQSAVRS